MSDLDCMSHTERNIFTGVLLVVLLALIIVAAMALTGCHHMGPSTTHHCSATPTVDGGTMFIDCDSY